MEIRTVEDVIKFVNEYWDLCNSFMRTIIEFHNSPEYLKYVEREREGFYDDTLTSTGDYE